MEHITIAISSLLDKNDIVSEMKVRHVDHQLENRQPLKTSTINLPHMVEFTLPYLWTKILHTEIGCLNLYILRVFSPYLQIINSFSICFLVLRQGYIAYNHTVKSTTSTESVKSQWYIEVCLESRTLQHLDSRLPTQHISIRFTCITPPASKDSGT